MSKLDSTVLPMVSDALSSVPGPIKTSFFKALGNLLGGLTAIPAAKLKQLAQGIEDTTAARSRIAADLADVVTEEAKKDPLLVQAASEILLPTALRKAKNRLNVAQSAAAHLAIEPYIGATGDEVAPPDDDWMNCFMRFAEDASSERMQDLFGRILAGQILRPGAFGLATLRTLSELDQQIANDFKHAWERSVGGAVDYSPEWKLGDSFSRWKRLSEVGLMAPTSASQFPPQFTPVYEGYSIWAPMSADGTFLNVLLREGSKARWDHIDFTRVGRELGSILPKPNYEENMRKAANHLPRHGLVRIYLHVPNKAMELVWQATL